MDTLAKIEAGVTDCLVPVMVKIFSFCGVVHLPA
jgi:hypothetical protein